MFLRASASDDRSPWGGFWFAPVGRVGDGARVTPDAAMRLTTVYACVRNISEDFAKLPFRLYKPKAGGGREFITDHWLYRLFTRRPNRWQTPFEFREMLQGHLALRGNAYCQILSNGAGEITDLIPQHPDRVAIELLAGMDYRYRVTDRLGNVTPFARADIWHVRGLSSDGYTGMSPIEVNREALAVGISAQDYAGRFFANDARPPGWIEMPGKFADNTARQTFRESVQSAQGGKNRGKTMVLDQGMKYHDIGLTNKDSQFIEARQMMKSDIASMFRMPPHKIGDLSKATFSNIEQQSIEYGTDTISPWAERWESSIEFQLLGDDTDYEVEFDLRILMRGDSIGRAMYYASGINAGWLVRNEARLSEGMDPIDGLDEPLRPLNMVEENEADPDPASAPVPPVQKPEPDPVEPDEDDKNARLHSMVTANAGRLGRRYAKAEVGAFDAALIAASLAVSLEAAAGWLVLNKVTTFTEQTLTASLVALGTSK
jgi:HK97 family phage portal protein